MAVPGIPNNFFAQTGNGAEVALSWDLTAGAISYSVQRSTDGITYSTVGTPSTNVYNDSSVTLGTKYYYKVAAVNGSGTGFYTASQIAVPSPVGELSLLDLRQYSQMKADRLYSQFVTLPEWNYFIGLALNELYDLLITAYEDYFLADPVQFNTDGNTSSYDLPNGSNFDGAPAFYKILGVDLAIQSSANAWVTLNKFNFIDRNTYVYPNSTSQIYGVFNMRYRIMGNKIKFIPTPAGNQQIQLWYAPRLQPLLQDTDMTTIGFSGWLQYVICRAAKYALDKEESDTSKLDAELLFLKNRIEEASQNRDTGQPDTISNIREASGGYRGSGIGGWGGGPMGGW